MTQSIPPPSHRAARGMTRADRHHKQVQTVTGRLAAVDITYCHSQTTQCRSKVARGALVSVRLPAPLAAKVPIGHSADASYMHPVPSLPQPACPTLHHNMGDCCVPMGLAGSHAKHIYPLIAILASFLTPVRNPQTTPLSAPTIVRRLDSTAMPVSRARTQPSTARRI
jgi:hypothetical protein